MIRRPCAQRRVLLLALLGLVATGCARGNGGRFAIRNPLNGTMKESLSRLQHENQELEDALASAKGEKNRLADELERSEGRANDLASRLDRVRGRAADDETELADQYDPNPGGSGRSTRASGRAPNKPPFTQIPNRIDVPTPPESTVSSRARGGDSSPLLDTPPVDYFDFDRDGGRTTRERPKTTPARPASGTSWAPVPSEPGRGE